MSCLSGLPSFPSYFLHTCTMYNVASVLYTCMHNHAFPFQHTMYLLPICVYNAHVYIMYMYTQYMYIYIYVKGIYTYEFSFQMMFILNSVPGYNVYTRNTCTLFDI